LSLLNLILVFGVLQMILRQFRTIYLFDRLSFSELMTLGVIGDTRRKVLYYRRFHE